MQKSYTKNYIKIYFWMGLSFSLNFLSMFIVMPLITKMPAIFGIYSLCISATIFLAYADLGFLGAAYKFASESYARKEPKEEIRMLGFASFVLLACVGVYAVAILIFAFRPWLLINKLTDPSQITIARELLIIMALFAPVFIFQRCLQVVYSIRLEDYVYQRINLVLNSFKIVSVYYFFRPSHYDIVGYFFFCQSMTAFGVVFCSIIAKNRYKYSFGMYFKSIRFSREMFNKTKLLAFSSLYGTITWILYYELDPWVIGKFFGAELLAFYAVGLSLMQIFRSIFGILYNPFSARFNHFVGVNNFKDLNHFYLRVVKLTIPVVLLPTISLIVLMKPFILSWVGEKYVSSVVLGQLLTSCYLFAYVSYPMGILLIAQQQLKTMNGLSTLIVILFWGGVAGTVSFMHLHSFALFKCVAFGISGIASIWLSARFLTLPVVGFLKETMLPMLIPLALLIGMLAYIEPYLPLSKGKMNLLIVIATGGACSLLALITYSGMSKYFRQEIWKAAKNIIAKPT
jgi:O-antigen/teichoic acid export membrane protein